MAHETADTRIRPIVLSGAGLALAAALVTLLCYGLLRLWEASPPAAITRPFAGTQTEFPPAPRLLEDPAAEMQTFRQNVRQRLTTYGWVDRSKGVVHIPIERAIDLQLQRGLPTREESGKQ